MRTLGVVLLLCGIAAAETLPEAGAKVLAALGDAEKLKELAQRENPDPWLVADHLWVTGKTDAAHAFAAAVGGKLPAYMATLEGRQPDGTLRSRVAEVTRLHGAGRPQEALEAAVLASTHDRVIGLTLAEWRGFLLGGLGKAGEAAKTFETAALAAHSIGWRARAERLFALASLQARQVSDDALEQRCLERVVAIRRARGDNTGADLAMNDIGIVLRKRRAFDEARAVFERLLASARARGDAAATVRLLTNLGSVESNAGELVRGRELLHEALRLSPDGDTGAKTLANLGMVLVNAGDYAEARRSFDQALSLARKTGNARLVARIEGGLAQALAMLGDFPQALELFDRALARPGLDPRRSAKIIALRAKLLEFIGDFRGAIEAFARVRGLARSVGDPAMEAAALLETANALRRSPGNDHRALDLLATGIGLARKARARSVEQSCEVAIGELLAKLGFPAKGEEHLRNALRIRRSAFVLASLAMVQMDRGAIDDARRTMEEALRESETTPWLQGRLEYEVGYARLLLRAGDARGAADRLARVLGRLPALLHGLDDSRGAANREAWNTVYRLGMRAGLALDDQETFSLFLESGRAGTLMETFALRDRLRRDLVPDALWHEELRVRARERTALAAGDRKRIAAARRDLLDVIGRIRRQSKAAAGVVYPEAYRLAAIRAILRPDETMVLFALLPKEAAALVVRRDAARLVRLGPAKPIEDACRRLRPALTRPGTRGVTLGHKAGAADAGPLRRLVLQPLGLGAETKRLLVSPHGILCYVPFAFLDEREIAYVPSGTAYGMLARERSGADGVLALGDPDATLAWARKEAQNVGSKVLLGKDASRAALLAAAKQPWRALHLACHGTFDPDRPLLSKLVLADDDPLRVLDVFRLRLRTDLVVLSACDTAKGRLFLSEGVLGLTWAFLAAGSPRVVSSLWKVDDEATYALMEKFYELWNDRPAAAALREAQRHVRAHWKHPSYWAAWQLWGLPH